jgi:uridine kinase
VARQEAAKRLPWNEALEHLEMLVSRASGTNAVVAITGPVGAGKSTLARMLAARSVRAFGSACVLSTDDYLPDYERVPEHERDMPERADFERLARDLASLRDGRVTRVPVWSFQSHSRVGEREVLPARVIVLEGIHALHEPGDGCSVESGGLAGCIDVRAFVEAPASVRWARWERIEASGERGWGVEVAREFFHRVAEPTFAKFEGVYRGRADVVVVNDLD